MMWASFLYNKKTSIIGAVVVLGSLAKIIFPGKESGIDQVTGSFGALFDSLLAIIAGVGLLFAKDGDKTGTP